VANLVLINFEPDSTVLANLVAFLKCTVILDRPFRFLSQGKENAAFEAASSDGVGYTKGGIADGDSNSVTASSGVGSSLRATGSSSSSSTDTRLDSSAADSDAKEAASQLTGGGGDSKENSGGGSTGNRRRRSTQ